MNGVEAIVAVELFDVVVARVAVAAVHLDGEIVGLQTPLRGPAFGDRREDVEQQQCFAPRGFIDAGALFIGKPGGAGGGVTAPYVLEEVGGGGQVLSTVVPVVGETVLLVVKAAFAAGNDTFTLYVNPTPGSPEPAVGVEKSDLNLGTTNSLLIYSGGEFSLDELRVGATFESVTPR